MDEGAAARPALLTALGAVNGLVLSVCKWLAIGLVAAIAIIVIASVIWRYGLNHSLAWAEDTAKFLMVWLAFIGAPLGFRHGAHVSIELLPPGLPDFGRRLVRLLVHAIVLALMAAFAWYGWQFAWNGRNQIALTIGDISMLWIFICIPIGAMAMALVSLELLLTVLLGLPEPALAEDEAISTQGM